ncbi:DUF190 domain-containing protein [Oceanibaculum nanhaiense]|jgi:nitrogen regulatory protein PII|uniref:DUF190 domain-containing protein n=1 Tax=Oceanibaculum nanhaiense TaxID=1909734 RepID=UPI000A3D10FA|nr:DUF190 domain-containing protein [Oceanibaculum nanhaiense]MBC7136441.1 DUF190 domain-containing protein [Oceanibaculum nanhaiense]MDM7945408.1 DUF190 domain-containing protein [Oceanibaculum nanhaiense]
MTDELPTHRKKKVEIVVEVARAPRILRMLTEKGATGYTVVPNLGGKGRRGMRGGADVVQVFDNVMIIAVTTEEIARAILTESQSLLKDYVGIVYMSDVEVVRDEHF